jgi:hypothetical protein
MELAYLINILKKIIMQISIQYETISLSPKTNIDLKEYVLQKSIVYQAYAINDNQELPVINSHNPGNIYTIIIRNA